jgi:F-type H+-transporting ATPase subunit gamma
VPSLKDLRNRINSVKSTQKITSAMKMVAAAKLRRAQEHAEAARPYAERMERMLGSLSASLASGAGAPRLLSGTGDDRVHLLIVATSDRGLCGGFNSTIVREVRRIIRRLQADGREVRILCVGRKGRQQLVREYGDLIVETVVDLGRPRLAYPDADGVARWVAGRFEAGEFDICTIVYNTFKSAMTQIVTARQLIPFAADDGGAAPAAEDTDTGAGKAIYEYEPDEAEILADLVPRNLSIQIFRALLENAASEQGARMTAMDSATRNAGEMIDKLTLNYNRTRQASITRELIEIISGAEAL